MPGSCQMGADTASCGRAGCSLPEVDACACKNYDPDFLKLTFLIQPRLSPSTRKHRMIVEDSTSEQKLKLHSASSIASHMIACMSSTDGIHELWELSTTSPAHPALCGPELAHNSCLAAFEWQTTTGLPSRRGRRTRSDPITVGTGTMAELEIPRGKAHSRLV